MKKKKISKEEKIKICKLYASGNGSFKSLAATIGVHKSSLQSWYARYKIYGEKAFNLTKRRYSKKFKEKIIKKHINEGFSISMLSGKYNLNTPTIRQWINLYKNATTSEEKEVVFMKKKKFSQKEKLKIIQEVINNSRSYKEVADKYSLKYARVYDWVNKYLKLGEDALKDSKKGPKPKKDKELSENEKLRKELEKEKELRKLLELKIKLLKEKEEIKKKLYHLSD